MYRFVGLLLAVTLLSSCATYQRIIEPPVKAYQKILVLLHFKKPPDPEPEAQPHVCLLDPTSQIPQSGDAPLHAGAPPAVEIAETTFNFGELNENGDYVHHFKVKNVGKGVLNITKVLPG